MAEVVVPSAVPLPRVPSVLLLGSGAGLLEAPGCPACGYTAECSDTYLTWFALEGHGDPDVLQKAVRIPSIRDASPRHRHAKRAICPASTYHPSRAVVTRTAHSRSGLPHLWDEGPHPTSQRDRFIHFVAIWKSGSAHMRWRSA